MPFRMKHRHESVRTSASGEDAPTVLLVEDDASMRTLLVAVLERDGLRVHEAADGAEALEYLRSCDGVTRPLPAVILTDGHMPRCTGYTVLAAIRRMELGTPVVFMTAFGDAETDEVAARLGARIILHKPFDVFALRAQVRELLSGAGRVPEQLSMRA